MHDYSMVPVDESLMPAFIHLFMSHMNKNKPHESSGKIIKINTEAVKCIFVSAKKGRKREKEKRKKEIFFSVATLKTTVSLVLQKSSLNYRVIYNKQHEWLST